MLNNRRGILLGRFAILLPMFITLSLSQEADHAIILRSTARLVQLSVIAEDKKGLPVAGLASDDFEIYDQGELQQIRLFSKESMLNNAASAPSVASTNSIRTFTNTAEARSGPAAVTVILIDSLNTRWVNQAYARRQVIKFLSQLRPDDHVAIYSMGFGGFQVLHDFTHDASDLIARIDSWKGEAMPVNPTSRPDIGRQLGDWLSGRNPDFVQSQILGDYSQSATVQSLRILTAIANELASIPGRKNLIWISEGFPLVNWGSMIGAIYGPTDEVAKMSRKKTSTQSEGERRGAEPSSYYIEMNTAMHAISDDNVAIYPVDALGLDNPAYNADKAFPSSMGTLDFQEVHARQNVMEDIAKRTGGKAFYETNDLMHAIRTAINDSKMTYTLGFYQQAPEFSGKFHTLKVRVVGRSDVRLHYRQGYFDSPEPQLDEKSRRLRVENAALSPLDANAIGLSATVTPDELRNGSPRMSRLGLMIDGSSLSFVQHGTANVAEVDILIVQKDDRGKQLDAVVETLRVEVSSDQINQTIKNGVRYNHDLSLNQTTSSLRIVVSDANSERLGSITIRHADLP